MNKSNHYCCVPQCKSWAKKTVSGEISFHLFPPDNKQKVFVETELGRQQMDRRKAWIKNLRIGKPVSNFMKVCSLHFTDNDYFHKGENTKRGRILKKTAVPSQNLPKSAISKNISSTKKLERLERLQNRSKAKVDEICSTDMDSDTSYTKEDLEAAEGLLQLLKEKPELDEGLIAHVGKSVRDIEIQVDTPRISTLTDLLLTESALRSFTGVNNFKILDCLVNMVNKVFHDSRAHRLSIKDRIIITLIKIKLDLSYVTIAILFNISGQLCKQYIFEMLSVLSSVLESCIYFPSSVEIAQNLPHYFKGFENTRVILDCIEITVQKPTCLCCRIRFYSQYKSSTTIKFMTGVSPAGIITFISEPYGGRASDKLIFEQSKLIEKLEAQKDAIMVDKGFLIEDLCNSYRIKLIRPPFLRNKKQLTSEETLLNQKIAAARVHIERSNQRLKIFKILSGKLQWSLVPKVKDIFIIVCGITNLSAPILSDQRF